MKFRRQFTFFALLCLTFAASKVIAQEAASTHPTSLPAQAGDDT